MLNFLKKIKLKLPCDNRQNYILLIYRKCGLNSIFFQNYKETVFEFKYLHKVLSRT